MTTIEIVSETSAEQIVYRATCGVQQAIGATPGQALDMLEKKLAKQEFGENDNIVVIVQRFRPDNFFTAKQQLRLQELMQQFHQANEQGETFAPVKKQELETLVDAEWNAAIERAEVILNKTQSNEQ